MKNGLLFVNMSILHEIKPKEDYTLHCRVKTVHGSSQLESVINRFFLHGYDVVSTHSITDKEFVVVFKKI